LVLLSPVFGYNRWRDAYLLRGVGQRMGPVLRVERRMRAERRTAGVERRRGNANWI
jgi:hypothetical protein